MPNDYTAFAEITGFVTILGLMAWLVRRVFTHTIPRLASDFRESLAEQQELFAKVLTKQQETFQKALEVQRADFKDSLQRDRTDFKDIMQEKREFAEKRLDRFAEVVDRMVLSCAVKTGGQ